jgi:hypothetical protein
MIILKRMDLIESRLHRLSSNQLRALLVLGKSVNGIISSTASGKEIKVLGKSLGGVFSSLSRQKIKEEHLVLPWGKAADGRGLRWKLNTKLISQKRLLEIVKELLKYE